MSIWNDDEVQLETVRALSCLKLRILCHTEARNDEISGACVCL